MSPLEACSRNASAFDNPGVVLSSDCRQVTSAYALAMVSSTFGFWITARPWVAKL